MALPAGRYGVTKNQLLKIKKLPMNTIKLIEEIQEELDTFGTAVTHDSTSVVTDSSDLVESGAVYDVVGWGNKNLLPPDYSDGNSKSQNGVTFTKNSDGTVTISIAQSATGNAYYYMYTTLEDFIERGKKYIVNSFLDNNSITFSCNDKVNNAWGNAVNSNGSDVEWTPRAEATAYGIWILVLSGTTAGTYVVKPMISKNGGAYEPYHESVSDSLAEKVGWDESEEYVSKNMLAVSSMSFHKTNHRVDYISIPELAKNTNYRLMVRYSDVSVATGDEELFFIRFGKNQTVSTASLHPKTDISGNQYFDLATVDSDITDNKNLYLGFNGAAQANDSLTVDLYLVPVEKHDNVDLTQNKADNSIIGTVEDGANPTKDYAVGEHMIRGGKFCTVTVPVNTSSTWTLGSNYVEGTIADNLVKQDTFSGTTSELGTIVIYNSNDRVILSVEVLGDTASLYKRSIGYGCVIKTPQGETLINTAVSGTYYYI